jgi:hypothetical protein
VAYLSALVAALICLINGIRQVRADFRQMLAQMMTGKCADCVLRHRRGPAENRLP